MSAAHAPASSASPVVDMDRWRAGSRALRTPAPAASTAAAPGSAGERPAEATVLPLPIAARRAPHPGQTGPVSVFGPVMAFGLRRRADAGLEEEPAALPLGETAVPVPAACGDGSAPAVTSWARGSRSRRSRDARGAVRGPRR